MNQRKEEHLQNLIHQFFFITPADSNPTQAFHIPATHARCRSCQACEKRPGRSWDWGRWPRLLRSVAWCCTAIPSPPPQPAASIASASGNVAANWLMTLISLVLLMAGEKRKKKIFPDTGRGDGDCRTNHQHKMMGSVSEDKSNNACTKIHDKFCLWMTKQKADFLMKLRNEDRQGQQCQWKDWGFERATMKAMITYLWANSLI